MISENCQGMSRETVSTSEKNPKPTVGTVPPEVTKPPPWGLHLLSMSFNKSQGQEFDCCLLDLTQPPFSHGHLYVALSRVCNASNIAVIVNERQILSDNIVIQIFVYQELLKYI